MPVSLSVKGVPDAVAERLRERARRNRRSMQGELLSILETTAGEGPVSVAELRERVARMGIKTPDEATAMIRRDRDAR